MQQEFPPRLIADGLPTWDQSAGCFGRTGVAAADGVLLGGRRRP